MHNAALDEAQAGIKIARRNINNLRYVDDHPHDRKQRGTKDQIAIIRWVIEKEREFQKNIYFCFSDYPKPLTV